MLRALHKSRIPIWHTEGFNPHPFATFPLPLSLGFRGVNECMDIKLEDDDYFFGEIISNLNNCLPRGIRIFKVTEPIMKAGKIAFARFTIKIGDNRTSSKLICEQINDLLSQETIEIEKKTKRGTLKTVDIKHAVKNYEIKEMFDYSQLDITLSAGSTDNVNPNLLISSLFQKFDVEYEVDITRNELFNSDMEIFR